MGPKQSVIIVFWQDDQGMRHNRSMPDKQQANDLVLTLRERGTIGCIAGWRCGRLRKRSSMADSAILFSKLLGPQLREELAWFGGFYEGEGSCRCQTRLGTKCKSGRLYPSSSLDLCQVNREPLDRIQRLFPFSTVYGPYKTKGAPVFRWMVFSYEQVQAVAAAMWPWLSSLRKQQLKDVLIRHQQLVNRPRMRRERVPGSRRQIAAQRRLACLSL
jgi:hypothetical protein